MWCPQQSDKGSKIKFVREYNYSKKKFFALFFFIFSFSFCFFFIYDFFLLFSLSFILLFEFNLSIDGEKESIGREEGGENVRERERGEEEKLGSSKLERGERKITEEEEDEKWE